MISLKQLIDDAIVDNDKRLIGKCGACGRKAIREIGHRWSWCTGCSIVVWECDCTADSSTQENEDDG